MTPATKPSKLPAKIRVLLVEDDPAFRDLLRFVLSQEPSFVIESVTDGVEALEAIQTNKPDILVLDILLPQMNGLELLRHLHNKTSLDEIYVVVISALGFQEVIEQAVEAGAQDFILKPVETDGLAERLRSGLESIR